MARRDDAPVAHGWAVGGDVEQALADVGVPSYVLDKTGVVRWINPAAERLLGDIRGKHYTSLVTAEERRGARELFTRKMLGRTRATEATGVLVSTEGKRITVEVSGVALMNGEQVVGVFGLIGGPRVEESVAPHPHLTPPQAEVSVFSNGGT
jgi:PAS domain S-box-containing protein